MGVAQSEPPYVGFYSIWRAGGMVGAMFALAILPLLPRASKYVTYTALFYTRLGFPILVVCCLGCFLLGLAMLPLLVRALRHQPAIEVDSRNARVFAIRRRDFPLSSMQSARKQSLNLVVRDGEGKEVAIPLWAYRDKQQVLAHLKVGPQ